MSWSRCQTAEGWGASRCSLKDETKASSDEDDVPFSSHGSPLFPVNRSGWKCLSERDTEHRSPALGFSFCRLVLDNIPVFDQNSVLKAYDVRNDPIPWQSLTGEPALQYHEIA